MSGHVKIPGTPPTRSRRQFDDEPVSIDTDRLSGDILAALADGPLMKWELRERLHVNEVAILRQLQRLRDDGLVKVIGKVLDKRAWALSSWTQPAAAAVSAYKTHPGRPPTAKPPLDSWWARPHLTWEDFTRAREARDRERGYDGSGQVARSARNT